MTDGFKIGTLAGGTAGLTLLSALTTAVPNPQASYQPFQKRLQLGSGMERGAGPPSAEWRFPRITMAERAQLRTFCSTASAQVYIRTIDDAGTLGNYLAVMVWPETEPMIQGSLLFDVTIRFTHLEAAT